MSGEKPYSVTISFQGFSETIRGETMEEVFRGVTKCLSQHLPLYDLVSGLVFKVDLERLLNELRGLVTFFSNGEFVLEFGPGVSDFDTVLICLVAAYVGYGLGFSEDSLTIDETFDVVKSSGLPYSKKTVNNRLGDLAKMNLARRILRGKYKVTELGIKHFLKESIPAIRGESEESDVPEPKEALGEAISKLREGKWSETR